MLNNILNKITLAILKKLAIVTTHPIQYNAPWFKLLSQRKNIQIKIFYTWSQVENDVKYDPGFGHIVEWDIPLLYGYDYTFVKNISRKPGSDHFRGINNPSLILDIETWNADSILVFGWCFKSHLKLLRYFKGKKRILFRGDSTLIDEKAGFSYKKIIRKFFLRWVYQYVDIALYVGSANKAYYKRYGLKESQLIFAPHAIDNDRFTDNNLKYFEAAQVIKQQLGLQSDDLVLLFSGKMESKKNPFFLIDLLKVISDPRLKVIFAGSGVLHQSLKTISANDKRIIVMDFQNQLNMPVIYRLADLFILPSTGPGETWGLAVNEAMACGLAVIASDKTGGAQDLIENAKNGLIINLPNNISLIKIILESLKNKNKVREMGLNSALKIKEFSFDKIVEVIEKAVNI